MKKTLYFIYQGIFTTVCSFGFIVASAQDFHLSQFTSATQLYNPAVTGLFEETLRATVAHRNQWSNIFSGYKTNLVDAQYKMLSYYNDNFTGFGLSVVQDEAGKAAQRTLSIKGNVAYHLLANQRNLISGGLQVGYLQRSIDWNGLAWDAQYNGIEYDPTMDDKERFLAEKDGTIDLSAGVNWRRKMNSKVKINTSAAIHHTNQSLQFIRKGNERYRYRQTATATLFTKGNLFDMRYDALYQRQGGAMEVMVGAMGTYRLGGDSRYTTVKTSSAVSAGVFYRWRDAVHPMVAFEFKRTVMLGVGYDIRIGKMTGVTSLVGGPEINLTYLGAFDRKRMKLY
jgi:type IX secretion system PorP/SprF family membrane protein